MKLLHVIPSVALEGGGPIEGIVRIGQELARTGHSSDIVCLDAPQVSKPSMFPGQIHMLGPSRGKYGYNKGLVPWLRQHSGEYDAVIVNGLWQYHSFATWRALRHSEVPYFVFTHGMLDPWFKRTYPRKHLKKWMYWPWAEYRVLRDAAAVMFTCEEERLLARESFWMYRCNEEVTAYGTAGAPAAEEMLRGTFHASFPGLGDKRILLFLSRIHEKKGCDLLIRAFAKVASSDPSLHLVIAGPDQGGRKHELQSLAARLGLMERVSWVGMLKDDLKWGAFYAAEVFCLPSHQENFGIVVAEALACGKPVILSDKVNIWREVQADGAGIVESDTLVGTVAALERWLSLHAEERRRMARAARCCFDSRFRIDGVVGSLIAIVRSRSAGRRHSAGQLVGDE